MLERDMTYWLANNEPEAERIRNETLEYLARVYVDIAVIRLRSASLVEPISQRGTGTDSRQRPRNSCSPCSQ